MTSKHSETLALLELFRLNEIPGCTNEVAPQSDMSRLQPLTQKRTKKSSPYVPEKDICASFVHPPPEYSISSWPQTARR